MDKFWNNKKVFVFGGAGFIGSHTADALVERGARVVIIDDLSTGKKENCHPRAVFYQVNTTEAARVKEIFAKERPDFVLIFSALVNIALSMKDPLLDSDAIRGMIIILQESVRHNVKKILYASSGFIYGNTKKRPTPETELAQPMNPYSISKATCEEYLMFFHHQYHLPFVALRYGTVYGPRRIMGPMFGYMRDISKGKRSEIYGIKTRDYIYIDDVVRANLIAIEKNIRTENPVYNIGTSREIDLRYMYRLIAKWLGQSDNKPIQKPGHPGEMDRFALAIEKAKRVLGFTPRVVFEDGLIKTLKWYHALPTHKKKNAL